MAKVYRCWAETTGRQRMRDPCYIFGVWKSVSKYFCFGDYSLHFEPNATEWLRDMGKRVFMNL
jgi:hypothetical protein